MNAETVIAFAREGVYITLLVAGPLLLIALITGLIVSIFQATTQIQEQTLAFIPKIIAVLVGLVVFGPWMLTEMVDYAYELFNNLDRFTG
ncbi:flagellar biosynthesis protein FliQ [Bacillaceae bacterium SIJ1]|uniref:flagellar biosynthesis protein FliQ n=1 Tax=Litoribacterium kuwaitense TaxID=1398745 RepID=UPI0013ED2ADE|nr:flagellar biosynthesis protein FliQ [Litoribacterium kuwaitense]NGP44113.1 flagellar biosynthesis protein FliQ [Litoribacterium kuwaitense]